MGPELGRIFGVDLSSSKHWAKMKSFEQLAPYSSWLLSTWTWHNQRETLLIYSQEIWPRNQRQFGHYVYRVKTDSYG
jgi:hypothetical protein